MVVRTNPYHAKIGTGNGLFPKTERGQTVGVYATPARWAAEDNAGMLTLYDDGGKDHINLTPSEARELADVLREMADKAEAPA